jgi:hypothetical protein
MRMLMVAMVALTIAMPANAAVICQKKNGAMFVREACKKKETPVDLAQFGAVGPTGPAGPAGPAGTDATARWAVVEADGTLQRGSHVVSTQKLPLLALATATAITPTAIGDGAYEVIFDRDVTNCAYLATLGTGDLGIEEPRGGITVAPRFQQPNGVFVATYDETLGSTDLPFHLAVFCP